MWFSININVILRTSPRYFVCCLLHSNIIYKSPKNDDIIICPQCKLFYHSKCHNWHFESDECHVLIGNEKQCPNCNVITEKISGCNHISCRCGKHWCFKCEQSPIFDYPFLCYEHMKEIHNESYFFYQNIIHIYLDKQDEKKIIKVDIEKVTLKIYVPIHLILFMHDHQNGNKPQINSYDEKNLFNKEYLHLPLVLDNIYNYDIIQSLIEIKSVFDTNFLSDICSYFDYSINKSDELTNK